MKTLVCLASLCLVLAACQPSAPVAPEPVPAPEPAPQPAPPAEPPTEAAFAAPEATAPPAPAEAPTHPGLVVETLDHGTFDLQAKRGGWVVVNFWATWCKPCLKEIPDFSAFDAARDDVTVIGLAYEEIDPQAMRDFLKQHPAGYPIALLDVYDPPADFATPRGLPMTYLIAPDGTVAERFLGPVTSQELAAAIEKAAAPAG